MNVLHLNYVDNLTMVESIEMKSQLESVPIEARAQPDCFRARTGHQLKFEESKLFSQLKKTQDYAAENKMKLNVNKTKLMLFNPCKEKDFMPEMSLEGSRIDLVENIKLLGVVLSSNLSWDSNMDYIVTRNMDFKKIVKTGSQLDIFA